MPANPFADLQRFLITDEDGGIRSYGPAHLGLQRTPDLENFWTQPAPEGFIGGATSLTELLVHRALEILCPRNGCEFTYQESFQGGRYAPGGSVIDFVVYFPQVTYLIRVQTSYFHEQLGARTHANDFMQKRQLEVGYGDDMTVIDVWETYFVDDPTGGAVMRVMQDAINGIEWPNPLGTGQSILE